MPKTRTISATAGSNTALRDAVAASDPKRASLAQTLQDAFAELTDTAVGIIDIRRSKVGIWATAQRTAVLASFAGLGGDAFILTPTDATKASTLWTFNTGVTPAVIGHPDYWTSDNGSGNPADVPEVAASPEIDTTQGMYDLIGRPTKPSLSVVSLCNKIEDAAAIEGNEGYYSVLVDQVAKLVTVRITVSQGTDQMTLNTPLAVFLGTVTDAAGTERQFGE